MIPATEDKPELSNFDVCHPADQSAAWKCCMTGGCCSTTRFFCQHCQTEGKNIFQCKINKERCKRCNRLHRAKCFCIDVCDKEHIACLKEELRKQCEQLEDEAFHKLDQIRANSKIYTNPEDADANENTVHIDYSGKDPVKLIAHISLLNEELTLRDVPPEEIARLFGNGGLGARNRMQKKLKAMVKVEEAMQKKRETVDRFSSLEETLEAVANELAVPCILHMFMRTVEKFFHVLINHALLRYSDSADDRKTRNKMVEAAERLLNQNVFGTKKNPGSWKLPWKENKVGMEKVSMDGERARRCLDCLDDQADLLHSKDYDQEAKGARTRNKQQSTKWNKLVKQHRIFVQVLGQKHDYSPEDIDICHVTNNEVITIWNDLTNGQEMTNYLHIMAAHMTYFMERYKNLYRYANHGWEALNQKIKAFYFHNTNHG